VQFHAIESGFLGAQGCKAKRLDQRRNLLKLKRAMGRIRNPSILSKHLRLKWHD